MMITVNHPGRSLVSAMALAATLIACGDEESSLPGGVMVEPTVAASFTSPFRFFCPLLNSSVSSGGTAAPGLPGYTALAPGAVSEIHPLTLPAAGDGAPGGMTHLLSFEQSCDNTDGNGGCCVLFLYDIPGEDANSVGCSIPFNGLVNPAGDFVGEPYDAKAEADSFRGRVYAESACAHTAPTVSTVATATTVSSVNGMGQVFSHSEIETQLIDGRQYFRDISRRASMGNGGAMAADAFIRVERFLDYQWPDDVYVPRTTYSYAVADGMDARYGPIALDALGHAQVVYDFFNGAGNVLGTAPGRDTSVAPRNSFDGEGSTLNALIEIPYPPVNLADECEEGYVIERGSDYNAFFDPVEREIGFTPAPAGTGLNSLSASFDVVAHEWSHAYLDEASNLLYERESGALSEALADWTAIRLANHQGRSDWLIGDDIHDKGDSQYDIIEEFFIRDLSQRRARLDDQWVTANEACSPSLCNDYCGVHDNSGVPNYMFYLLANGGSFRPDSGGGEITIEGIGVNDAYAIAYYANNNFFSPTSSLSDARAGMTMAARTLFPNNSSIERQVQFAWAAVGVGSINIAPPDPGQGAKTGAGAALDRPQLAARGLLPLFGQAGPETAVQPPDVGPKTVDGQTPPVSWPKATVNTIGADAAVYELDLNERAPLFQVDYTPFVTNLIGIRQHCSNSPPEGCCFLSVGSNQIFPDHDLLFDYHFTGADPDADFVGGLFEEKFEDGLLAQVRGKGGCSFGEPFSIAMPTEDTLAKVDLSGQFVEHQDIDVQQLGGRTFLRDVTRRASMLLGGQLVDGATITAEQWHDYTPEGEELHISTALHSIDHNHHHELTPIDRGAVDAFAYTQKVYDYFLEHLSINSLGDGGSSISAIVEVPYPTRTISNPCGGEPFERGSSYNAFYSGGTSYYSTLRRGFTVTLSSSPEVVAHELGHGYLDHYSRLRYSRDSGALNEAFADWTGVVIARSLGQYSWKVGDDVYSDGRYFRDMAIPRFVHDSSWRPNDLLACPSPALCNDYCWLHYNSAIPNFMFYLLSEGGSQTPAPAGREITVDAIGSDTAYRIAFSANQNFWTSTTNFTGGRSGMVMAATILYPDQPNVADQVRAAWAAVGVGEAPQSAYRDLLPGDRVARAAR